MLDGILEGYPKKKKDLFVSKIFQNNNNIIIIIINVLYSR